MCYVSNEQLVTGCLPTLFKVIKHEENITKREVIGLVQKNKAQVVFEHICTILVLINILYVLMILKKTTSTER